MSPDKPDDIDPVFTGGVENFLARLHDAEIDHVEPVALQNHTDDILADIVDIALDRGHQDFAIGLRRGIERLFRFHVGHQVGHGFLHDPRRFHYLGQEHLASAEQVTDDIHAVHERAFNNIQRALDRLPGFFRVEFDEFVDTLDQRMLEPLVHRQCAPCLVFLFLDRPALAAVTVREGQQAVRGAGITGQNHILDHVPQFGRNIFINRQLTGIDDTHIHAVTDGVVQEYRMDRLAHGIVAPEREGNIRHAA